MKKRYLFSTAVMVCVFLLPVSVFGVSTDFLSDGIQKFQSARYDEALLSFREIILDSNLSELHSDAYFWISKSYLALRKLEDASRNIDFFLDSFPGHRYYPEALYQKGRLLFLQAEYEKSIIIFKGFIDKYKDSPFTANSYYWIAESLYISGHFEEAHMIFSMIVNSYPSSFKVEASRYKVSLIDLKYRENELLKLLKMSHEEYLKSLEDFQRRERSYEQAISSYQKRLGEALSEDTDSIIKNLDNELLARNTEIDTLKSSISTLNAEISELKKELEDAIVNLASREEVVAAPDTPAEAEAETEEAPAGDSLPLENSRELLSIKADALFLKEFYLNWLEQNLEMNQ